MIKLPKNKHVIPKFKVIQLNILFKALENQNQLPTFGHMAKYAGSGQRIFLVGGFTETESILFLKHKTYSEYQLLKSEVPYNFLTACTI